MSCNRSCRVGHWRLSGKPLQLKIISDQQSETWSLFVWIWLLYCSACTLTLLDKLGIKTNMLPVPGSHWNWTKICCLQSFLLGLSMDSPSRSIFWLSWPIRWLPALPNAYPWDRPVPGARCANLDAPVRWNNLATTCNFTPPKVWHNPLENDGWEDNFPFGKSLLQTANGGALCPALRISAPSSWVVTLTSGIIAIFLR